MSFNILCVLQQIWIPSNGLRNFLLLEYVTNIFYIRESIILTFRSALPRMFVDDKYMII